MDNNTLAPTEHEPTDVRGAAAILDCGPANVRRLVRAGKLKAAQINDRGDLRIYRSWIREFLESQVAR